MILMAAFTFLVSPTVEAEGGQVARAFVGGDNLVHIINRSGREFVAVREANPLLPNDSGATQESVTPPEVAQDGRTVGWIVNFGNCCTSYPIPLELLLYRDGKIIQKVRPSTGPPTIWEWHFVGGGGRVALYSDTLHGESNASCELHDVSTGKLIQAWSGHSDAQHPAWVTLFAGKCDLSED